MQVVNTFLKGEWAKAWEKRKGWGESFRVSEVEQDHIKPQLGHKEKKNRGRRMKVKQKGAEGDSSFQEELTFMCAL